MASNMVLPVVKYGDPVLRKKGARVEGITPAIRQLVGDMMDTMEDASGVGLAAQQVGHALQLMVLDVRGVKDRPSTLEMGGQAVDPADYMPMALLNPEITPLGPPVKGPEGCLSFPELYGDVVRPELIDVRGLSAEGEPLQFRCGGLLARAIQHELDHLNGILFIDRMTTDSKREIQADLDQLHADTKAALKQGGKRK